MLKIKKWDFIIMALVLVLAGIIFAFFAPRGSGEYAVITKDGKQIYKVNLNSALRTYEIDNVVIEIGNGHAAFVSSDCPDKVCIHSGKLSVAGQVAACVPNKISLTIEGQGDIDALRGS